MYNFILNQWRLRNVDTAWVQAQVPKWITQQQADTIIATPQVPAEQ